MNVLANGHNSEQVSKRVRCAESLQVEITTESPLLPWLVRRCGVAGEAHDLVLWSDELGGLLEPAQEERKERPKGPNPAEKATHELAHTSFRNCCSYCVRARAADDPHHRQPHKEP